MCCRLVLHFNDIHVLVIKTKPTEYFGGLESINLIWPLGACLTSGCLLDLWVLAWPLGACLTSGCLLDLWVLAWPLGACLTSGCLLDLWVLAWPLSAIWNLLSVSVAVLVITRNQAMTMKGIIRVEVGLLWGESFHPKPCMHIIRTLWALNRALRGAYEGVLISGHACTCLLNVHVALLY